MEMVVVDQDALRHLPGQIAIARTGQALALGDVAQAVSHARRVLDLVPEADHVSRGGASAFLGLAAWASGELETAHRMYADGMAHLQLAGNISDVINGSIRLADIRIAQGRLREAMRSYERGLGLATAQHPALGAAGPRPVLRGAADVHVGMSMLHRERNDLQAATWHLQSSTELGEHSGFPHNRYRRCIALARIRQVAGDLDGALALLDEAERRYMRDFSPNVRPIAALKARVWLAQGRLGDALDWAREQDLSPHDDLSYLREFEHITLARLLLARYQRDREERSVDEALALLDRLLRAAEQGERTGSVIEILIVQALAHQTRGNSSAALGALRGALSVAEPEGYVRIFVDEGLPMVHMLLEATARGILPDYTGMLLAAWGSEHPGRAGDPPPRTAPTSSPLVEPLSERELDVLRLFKTELSGPEIANELMIAVSTVRTHTKSIFSKLDVTNRRAAVIRAAELGLI
jgi:LuxR family maltose regulon positive regulatory protein